ncbi:MAG: hypothetical protein RLO50_15250 [Azospirillaceae bacterium]
MTLRPLRHAAVGGAALALASCASPFEPDPGSFAVSLVEEGCLPALQSGISLAALAADRGLEESLYLGIPGLARPTAAWAREVRGSTVRLVDAPGFCAVVVEDTDTTEIAGMVESRIGGLTQASTGMPVVRIPGLLDFAVRSYVTTGSAPRRITVTSLGTAADAGFGDNTLITVE